MVGHQLRQQMYPLKYKQLKLLTPLWDSSTRYFQLVNYCCTLAEKFKEVMIILMIIAN